MRADDRAAFVRDNTEVLPVPLVPEVRLHLAHEAVPIWQKTEEQLAEIGLPPPFWAFAWAGGQALARYVLDHIEMVRGRSVLDLASGSGLVGIAAAKAGAAHVLCADVDVFSVEAVRLNAALNGVAVDVTQEDLLARDLPAFGCVLVGDLFYEKGLAQAALAFLHRQQSAGATVLVGDPGRSYLPREALVQVAEYSVPVSRELEDSEIKRTAVWRLR
ncbi:MAG: methyltransferase [Hyphomicrobiales bacterium]